MHLTAYVESADHVCCRYRVTAFGPHLLAAGHRLDLRMLPNRWFDRLRTGSDASAVLLQRRLLPPWQLALLRRRCDVLLYDFDDAVFVRDSYSPKGPHSSRRSQRFAHTVRAADAVVAGNVFLAEQACRFTDPDRVVVIPTCVDPSGYRMSDHSGDTARLVWVGSSSTLNGLEQAAPLLEAVGRAVPGARLKLVCDRFLRLNHLPVVERHWSAATEADELADAEIGIAWVPDDDWSRGKCGLKVLQYLAAGLPVVANPVGVHTEMVRDGVTGFLARTADEWADAVRALAADPDLRRRMGRAGRALVESQYSVRAGAARWLTLLRSIARAAA